MSKDELKTIASRINEGLSIRGEFDEALLNKYFLVAQNSLGADDTEEVIAFVRLHLGQIERGLGLIGDFDNRDAVYIRKMDIIRRYFKYRGGRSGGFSFHYRGLAYSLWRLTSKYGTSPLRVIWTAGNIALIFSFLYFFIDVIYLFYVGSSAFADGVIVKPLSYFMVGIQGMFPGTAMQLGTMYIAHILLTVENLFGAFMVVSLFASVSRKFFSGGRA